MKTEYLGFQPTIRDAKAPKFFWRWKESEGLRIVNIFDLFGSLNVGFDSKAEEIKSEKNRFSDFSSFNKLNERKPENFGLFSQLSESVEGECIIGFFDKRAQIVTFGKGPKGIRYEIDIKTY